MKSSTKPTIVKRELVQRDPDQQAINRRDFTRGLALMSVGLMMPLAIQAKTYLSIDQAKSLLFPGETMTPVEVTLSPVQIKAIRRATKTKVINASPQIWRTESGGWLIVDQVIGKHENIDMAYGLNTDGSVKGLEILTYRESYGYEVAHPKWRAQFHGKTSAEFLKLDKQIRNISGATLSCRHITDGVNRLTYTWDTVLQHLT